MLGDQPIVSESQLAALGFATSGGCSPSSDIHCQRSMSVERWQCLFRAQPLTFPFFHRTFPFLHRALSFFHRHKASDHRAVVTWPSGGGRWPSTYLFLWGVSFTFQGSTAAARSYPATMQCGQPQWFFSISTMLAWKNSFRVSNSGKILVPPPCFCYFLYLCTCRLEALYKIENSQSVKRRHICFIRFLLKSLENFEYWKRWIWEMCHPWCIVYLWHSPNCVPVYRTQDGAYFVHSFQRLISRLPRSEDVALCAPSFSCIYR